MLTVALTVLVVARVALRFVPEQPPGRGIDVVAGSFGWLLVLFFVPALPIRYGLGFGAAYASAAGAALLAVVAAVSGVREAIARSPGRPVVLTGQLGAALVAGLCGAASAFLLPNGGYAEIRLLWATAAFLGCAISVCAVVDQLAAVPAPQVPDPIRGAPVTDVIRE